MAQLVVPDRDMCDEFIDKFSEVYTEKGLYEECISFALDKIGNIEGVKEETLGRDYYYFVTKNSMGVFQRSLRQLTIKPGTKIKDRKQNPANFNNKKTICTTETARNAISLFFKTYPKHTLIFSFGSSEHEQHVYIRRTPGDFSKKKTKPLEFLFYDSNKDQNVLSIGQELLKFYPKITSQQCYANALHDRYNYDVKCGHYSFLEMYLNLYYGVNPFNPFNREALNYQSIIIHEGHGHSGPRSLLMVKHDEINRKKPSDRNIYTAKNQTPKSSEAKSDAVKKAPTKVKNKTTRGKKTEKVVSKQKEIVKVAELKHKQKRLLLLPVATDTNANSNRDLLGPSTSSRHHGLDLPPYTRLTHDNSNDNSD